MANPSENTPLLGAPEPTTDTSDIEAGPATLSPTAPVLARDHFKRPIRILTKLILITSSIAIILAMTNAIILETAPFSGGRYSSVPQVILLLGFFVRPPVSFSFTPPNGLYLTNNPDVPYTYIIDSQSETCFSSSLEYYCGCRVSYLSSRVDNEWV
jgi:hypothetical protein